MKRRIKISIALALSVVLVSLMSSDSTVNGQSGQGSDHAWGIFVTPGPEQMLRITVVNTDRNRNANVRFGRQSYTQEMCNADGVCKLVSALPNISAPITLMPSEAASFDISPNNAFAVRGVVLSNRPNVRVTAMIMNTTTGKIDAFFDIFTE